MNLCECSHEAAAHGGYRPGREHERGCLAEGCPCENYISAHQNGVKIVKPRKARRAMTEMERQEWRDLQRRVKKYEETFGVRYVRD